MRPVPLRRRAEGEEKFGISLNAVEPRFSIPFHVERFLPLQQACSMLHRLLSCCCLLTTPLLCWGAAAAHDTPGAHSHPGEVSGQNVRITVRGDSRYLESVGLPDHTPGQFPNAGNPNRITPQRHQFRVPADPQPARQPTPLGMQPFGLAINGVPFDPGAAEFWQNNPRSGWQYEAMSGAINLGLDQHHAHVQPTGAYHYHGLPTGLYERLAREREGMILLGYAADGFPIYGPRGYSDPEDAESSLVPLRSSYRLKRGTRTGGPEGTYDGTFVADYEYVPGLGDLDECNGRTGVTAEYPDGTYYYVITEEFPFIPRQFRGTPDASFARRGPPPGGGGFRGPPPPGRRPPPPR